MEINQLCEIIKKKILEEKNIKKVQVEDKSFLHKKHKTNKAGKFHIKLNFYKKVQKGYYKISKNNGNYVIIDSNKKNTNEVKKIIINKLEKII